jgi:endonuclease YncB( thermonuclease family)
MAWEAGAACLLRAGSIQVIRKAEMNDGAGAGQDRHETQGKRQAEACRLGPGFALAMGRLACRRRRRDRALRQFPQPAAFRVRPEGRQAQPDGGTLVVAIVISRAAPVCRAAGPAKGRACAAAACRSGVPRGGAADIAPDQSHTAAIIPPAPIGKPVQEASAAAIARSGGAAGGSLPAGTYQARFFLCGTAKQDDCVSSPDRFVFHGQKIRLVGIEVPDIKKPRCDAERIKASDAELRVRAFLDSGPFELRTWQGNDDEVDGHRLRDVTRNGMSLSDILVRDGLAHKPGASGGWCG